MSNDRKIMSGMLGGLGYTGVTIVIGFVQLRLLLAYLSPVVAGVWILFITFGTYVGLADLGIGPTLGREISFAAAREQGDERNVALGTLVRSGTFAAAMVALLVLLLGLTAGWLYLASVTPEPLRGNTHQAWIVFLVGACINLIGQGWLAAIFGLGETMREKQIRSVGLVAGFALFVAALVLHTGMVGLSVSFLLQCITTVWLARRSLRLDEVGFLHAGKVDLRLLRRLAVPSLKYAGTVLGGVLILQTDNLVIASRLGTSLIVDYQAVSRLVSTMMALSIMLVVTTAPFQSQAHARQDLPEVKRLLTRSLKFSVGMMAVFSAMLACFADRIIDVWLGVGHFVGFPIVWIMLLVMILEAHHSAMAQAVMATGEIAFTKWALAAGVLNLVFSVYLAGRMGLFGVALGTFCAQVITNNWYAPFYAMRLFEIPLWTHLRSIVLPILLLIAGLLGAGYGLRILLGNTPAVVQVFAGCGMVGLLGVAGWFTLVMSAEDRGYVFARLPKLKSAT